MTGLRVALASLVAPWVPALVLAAAIGGPLETTAMFGGFVALGGYAGVLAFGLPGLYLLRRRGWLDLPRLVLWGAAAGVAAFYAWIFLALGASLDRLPALDIVACTWGAGLGLTVSLAFGVIAGVPWRRAGPGVRGEQQRQGGTR